MTEVMELKKELENLCKSRDECYSLINDVQEWLDKIGRRLDDIGDEANKIEDEYEDEIESREQSYNEDADLRSGWKKAGPHPKSGIVEWRKYQGKRGGYLLVHRAYGGGYRSFVKILGCSEYTSLSSKNIGKKDNEKLTFSEAQICCETWLAAFLKKM